MFRFRVACLLRKPCNVSVLTGRAAPPGTEWRNYATGFCHAVPSGALRRRCAISTRCPAPPGTEWRNYAVCRTAPSGALWRHCAAITCRSVPSGAVRSKCTVFTRRSSPIGGELRHCTMGTCHLSTPIRHVPAIACQLLHTSSSCRAMPAPLLWLLVKPAQRLVVIILGRSIGKWWRSLPPNRKEFLRQEAWRRRWYLAAVVSALLTLLATFGLTHLDESPITGRVRLLVFSREQFMELANLTAEEMMEEFKESIISLEDPRHKAVEMVVKHLAQRNQDIAEMASMPWSVHVLDHPSTNAFVLPNGEIFVFTGMLDAIADIHQLTFVLGHEMAHAIIGHSAEQVSLSHLVNFLSLILLTAIWALCPRDSLAALGHWIQGKLMQLLFDHPYSRKLETEADEVGLQLAAKACADVRGLPLFWQQMEREEQQNGNLELPEWLSTHPSHRNRSSRMERLIPQALELRASCNCPALPRLPPQLVVSGSVRPLEDGEGKQNAVTAKDPDHPPHPRCRRPLPHTGGQIPTWGRA
ncbi:metalloendopeptidase OMA1, mitochondrial [Paramormyrops kingsleyae]|uniref:metalloendopeptidase OMA1, mitochondrial n=1 Tax=Paramormyrops kingsleyae TaxID=1676925 RepID=UPI003B9717A7